MGGDIKHILINDLRNDTFYASIVIERNGKLLEVDSRPSDAINLAVRARVPIYVAESVMDQAASMPEEKPNRHRNTQRVQRPHRGPGPGPVGRIVIRPPLAVSRFSSSSKAEALRPRLFAHCKPSPVPQVHSPKPARISIVESERRSNINHQQGDQMPESDNIREASVRMAPHNVEAEEAVLGSVLIDPEAIFRVSPFLRAEDFFIVKNGWCGMSCWRCTNAASQLTFDGVQRIGGAQSTGRSGRRSLYQPSHQRRPTAIHAEGYGASSSAPACAASCSARPRTSPSLLTRKRRH